MPWIPPKTDWTSEDDFNYFDMNRVENNTEAVKEALEQLQGPVQLDDIVTDREMLAIDFDDDFNRIESNIATLAAAFYEPMGWQDPKMDWQGGVSRFSYLDAIRLELNLKLLYELITITLENLNYCGEFYCGEEVV
jgi:hypothetical protein